MGRGSIESGVECAEIFHRPSVFLASGLKHSSDGSGVIILETYDRPDRCDRLELKDVTGDDVTEDDVSVDLIFSVILSSLME